MQRLKILHRTYYNYSSLVRLDPHALRLRPKEGHELRIESSSLKISPDASLNWHRDVEDNSVAIATFDSPTRQLSIDSEIIIQQFNQAPLDFIVADYAINYPFEYGPEDRVVLSPYLLISESAISQQLFDWIKTIWTPSARIQTYSLLYQLCLHMNQTLSYKIREEQGVQSARQTILSGSGSCRDYANLFIEISRHLGLAARFVSGYLKTPPSADDLGATHAWAEVYLPGAGWKGFDPTSGEIAGSNHIPVAVARLAESVPPVAGAFIGPARATLDVGVWVTDI